PRSLTKRFLVRSGTASRERQCSHGPENCRMRRFVRLPQLSGHSDPAKNFQRQKYIFRPTITFTPYLQAGPWLGTGSISILRTDSRTTRASVAGDLATRCLAWMDSPSHLSASDTG